MCNGVFGLSHRANMFYTSIIFLAGLCGTVFGRELHLWPDDDLSDAFSRLEPGDTLTLHSGVYTDRDRVVLSVKASREKPVLIRGAPGEDIPLITRRLTDSIQNTIDIEGARFVTIRDIEITGNGGDGINMKQQPSHLTLEYLVIHDISVGINFRSDMQHITVRGNHIFNTNDTGEGMYIGCNYAECVVSHSLIEGNWVHDTLNATQGDGIEIKKGSHSNIVRNNKIHDTNYPCILVYGTEGQPQNIVDGNIMWNCGDSGIQAAADAVIRNNIILDEQHTAFNSQPHQGVTPRNLQFVHNTVFGGTPCLILQSWSGQQGMVFANNAIYCDSDEYSVDDLAGVSFSGNVISPPSRDLPATGQVAGRSAAEDFLDVETKNAYPRENSALIGAGDSEFVIESDFDGVARKGGAVAGAYTIHSSGGPREKTWPQDDR